MGKAFGRRTFLVTTLRPVPPGTDGAMSVEGTLAGVAASLLVAALGVAAGLLPAAALWLLPIAAFVANLLESLLGATLERRGLLDNEAVNFLNTLAAALFAAAAGAWVPLSTEPLSRMTMDKLRLYNQLARPVHPAAAAPRHRLRRGLRLRLGAQPRPGARS